MAILNFNAQQHEPSASFDPLPAGWYNARMVESELKPTKAGDGQLLSCQFEVIDGQFAGRRVFTNFNMKNKNPVAEKIANEQLTALCYCTGVIQCKDSTQLHGIPVQIKLSIREASGGYDAANDVKAFRDQHGREAKDIKLGAAAPGGPAAPASPAAPAAPAAPPAAAAAAPAAAAHDPIAAAVADGWIAHPTAPGHHYKGQDVKPDADLAAMYPAPVAAPPPAPTAPPAPPVAAGAPPAPPAAPVAAAPAAPAAPASPPWEKPAA